VQVTTKLAEKTRVGLLDQLVILKAVWGVIEGVRNNFFHILI
jgi:hypothetical protein